MQKPVGMHYICSKLFSLPLSKIHSLYNSCLKNHVTNPYSNVPFNCKASGVTCRAGTANLSGAPEFTRFLVWFVLLDLWFSVLCFVDRCFSFCPFSFGHCVVCSSSFGHCVVCSSLNYGFWLPV